jgi:hypothetical protein
MSEIPVWLIIMAFGLLGFILVMVFNSDSQDGDNCV